MEILERVQFLNDDIGNKNRQGSLRLARLERGEVEVEELVEKRSEQVETRNERISVWTGHGVSYVSWFRGVESGRSRR